MNSASGRPRGSQIVGREQDGQQRDGHEQQVQQDGQLVLDVGPAEDRALRGSGLPSPPIDHAPTVDDHGRHEARRRPARSRSAGRLGQMMSTMTTSDAPARTREERCDGQPLVLGSSPGRCRHRVSGREPGDGSGCRHGRLDEVEHEAREDADDDGQRDQWRQRQDLDRGRCRSGGARACAGTRWARRTRRAGTSTAGRRAPKTITRAATAAASGLTGTCPRRPGTHRRSRPGRAVRRWRA